MRKMNVYNYFVILRSTELFVLARNFSVSVVGQIVCNFIHSQQDRIQANKIVSFLTLKPAYVKGE